MEKAKNPSSSSFAKFIGIHRNTAKKYWDTLQNDTPLEKKMTMPCVGREIKNPTSCIPTKCQKLIDYIKSNNITEIPTKSELSRDTKIDRGTIQKYFSQICEQIAINKEKRVF